MTINLREVERDQLYLLPPSIADWLPEDHLAWFVLDVVNELDFAAFESAHREDGRGGASYHPGVMCAVLLYAYCTGERSSRRIERHLIDDVAYRVLAANQTPDHATIARFRRRHEEAIGEVFIQVLGLCVKAGIVDTGLVAIDGTKIEANASWSQNRSRRELVREILDEAEETDAKEDRAFGETRGDELPREWASRKDRQARIKEALRQLDADEGDFIARLKARKVRETEAAAQGRHLAGKRPSPSATRTRDQRMNITDPDSRVMRGSGRAGRSYIQSYNAQAAATTDQVIVAAEVTNEPNDARQLAPLVAATTRTLEQAGSADPVGTFLADAGYWSTTNAEIETTSDLLIAPAPAPASLTEPGNLKAKERQNLVARVVSGEITPEVAQEVLGVSAKRLAVFLRIHAGKLPDHGAVREAMQEKLAEEDNAKRYALRQIMIEPVFGNIKANYGYRSFSRRGINAVRSEWKLICAAHNLLKLRKLGPTPQTI